MMDFSVSLRVLRNLIYDPVYMAKVLPFLNPDYFHKNPGEKVVFESIKAHIDKYRTQPTPVEVGISVKSLKLSNGTHKSAMEVVKWMEETKEEKLDIVRIVDETEKWVRKEAIYLALAKSLEILDETNTKETMTVDAIPDILGDALAINFNVSVGHDYWKDYKERYEFYHDIESRIPFGLDYFNKITGGGIGTKSLSVVAAGTNVGKSLFLCDYAAHGIRIGKNVLYITAEMAEEKVAERIDANLLDIEISNIPNLTEDDYYARINEVQQVTPGRLIIKEYPTGTAHVGHIRALLKELIVKQDFKPHIIIIDYLNIMASSRYKNMSNTNSYSYIKAIAEEFRGLAMEFEVAIWSATQFNRGGMDSSDPSITNTSDSMGLPFTVDFMFAMVTSDELAAQGQFLIKQLKNRFADNQTNQRFVIGVDKAKMRLYNLEESAQDSIMKSAGAKKAQLELEDEADVYGKPPSEKKFGSKFGKPSKHAEKAPWEDGVSSGGGWQT